MIRRVPVVLAAGLALVVLMTAAGAAPAVHTYVGEVRACAPLEGGDLLVGTGGGLVRMGRRGELRAVWTAIDGLPGTRIDSISRVGGALWIGTDAGAAQVALDGTTLAIRRTAETRSVRDVVSFGGALYVATWEGGVRKLGARGSTAMPFRGGNHPRNRARVAALAVADGALWAGTAGGLYKLTAGRFELVTIEAGANEVTSLHGDGATLWIATTAGLYARTGGVVRGYGAGDARRVTEIDGEIVVAMLGAGVQRVDRGRLVAVAGGPGALVMPQALAAAHGAACAGGLDGLVVRATPDAPWIAATPPSGLPANDVSAIAADGGRLWVGMFDHGVAVHEAGRWRRITHRNLDHRVNALVVDRRARVWVATATGVSIIDGAQITQLTRRDGLPARGVLSLTELRDGRILAGTINGAAILGDGRPVVLGLKQNLEVSNVWAVAEDAAGWLWLGTTTGLYRGRADDTAWTRYAVATRHLRDDWVMALATRGTSVWVGTYKGGVTRFDATGTEVAATALGDGWINPGGLTWHGDALFAATMEGVRVGDGASATWTAVAGVPGRDTTATARVGTTLWISTRRGLVARAR